MKQILNKLFEHQSLTRSEAAEVMTSIAAGKYNESQIAAFISTLMMVGIVTMPVEISYFGKKATIVRNVAAFGFSFIVALVMGALL